MIGSVLGRSCGHVARRSCGGAMVAKATMARVVSLSTKAAAAASASAVAPPPSGAGGQRLGDLTGNFPHMDVVKYEHKNRTWTLQHVHYYSEALAIGLTENGLQSGDVVLSWLPHHFSETMVLQFACSKAGMVLYNLDPSTAIEDPGTAQEALQKALELSRANVLVSQEAGSDVNYINIAQAVIPELRIYATSSGMPFVTPRFPDLRMCVQTGFDQDEKQGWFPLRHCIVPSDNLDLYVEVSKIGAKTPLAGEFKLDAKGVPTGLGPVLTNEQVLQKNVWPTYSAILDKKYHEVEGVGVVF